MSHSMSEMQEKVIDPFWQKSFKGNDNRRSHSNEHSVPGDGCLCCRGEYFRRKRCCRKKLLRPSFQSVPFHSWRQPALLKHLTDRKRMLRVGSKKSLWRSVRSCPRATSMIAA